MSLRKSVPLNFSPRGCCDALDSSDVSPGAMSSLRNLIPDPTTKNLWACRPASKLLYDFVANTFGDPWSTGFSNGFGPFTTSAGGFISALKVIGNRAYGLIGLNGNDYPFCYDLSTNALVAITGATGANTPTSTVQTGSWTPPTIDVIGVYVIFTHPGFNTVNGYFGSINISNPASLAWTSGNTATNALAAPPTAVKNFNGRAYYIVNPGTGQPGLYYSDVLTPLTITNANQILTFDDNVQLTALGALGVEQTTGGILQALIVYKGVSNIYQVTGDAALSTLAKNSLNINTGTQAPNSLATTPRGLAFISPEGLRIIDFTATASPPVGDSGEGITVPFIFAVQPSRMAGAYTSDTYRISTQNGNAAGTPNQEWWFDFSRKVWSGPHDFPPSLIQPYNLTFIMTPLGVNAKLFQSDAVPSTTSTYVENGTQMTYSWQTSLLPDTNEMAENAMVETTIHMALAPGVPPLNVTAQDQNGVTFDTVSFSPVTAGTLWDAFNWRAAVWGGGISALAPRPIPWHHPIVFRRLTIGVVGQAAQAVKVGRLNMRYETLGYLQQ